MMKEVVIEKLYIETTKDERIIRILLPDDYHESQKTYGVIYMHDGQNLFEDETAYGGHSWGIYEAKKVLIENEGYEDMIIVGIDNSSLRLDEYSPWKGKFPISDRDIMHAGGLGDTYTQFIVNQVIPYIDSQYRTKHKVRYIAGSSMGAYISQYIISKYPDLFLGAGIFSLASWFNENDFLSYVKESKLKSSHNFFISIGRHESSSETISDFNEIYLQNSRNLRDLLASKNIKCIDYIETDDVHNELAWRKVFPRFYHFINQKAK